MPHVKPPPDPPATVDWPANAKPPMCAPECGVDLKPVAFIVIWEGWFKPGIMRTNPLTLLPETRTLIHVNERWYFMDSRGCWSTPPAGFDTQPQTTVSISIYILPAQASTVPGYWSVARGQMHRKGALEPGSIHYLAVIAKQLPPRGDFDL